MLLHSNSALHLSCDSHTGCARTHSLQERLHCCGLHVATANHLTPVMTASFQPLTTCLQGLNAVHPEVPWPQADLALQALAKSIDKGSPLTNFWPAPTAPFTLSFIPGTMHPPLQHASAQQAAHGSLFVPSQATAAGTAPIDASMGLSWADANDLNVSSQRQLIRQSHALDTVSQALSAALQVRTAHCFAKQNSVHSLELYCGCSCGDCVQ